jgi:hypothetical protein
MQVARQLLHAPVREHATLPNFRWLAYRGVSAYLEAFLPRITSRLEKLQIIFFTAHPFHPTPPAIYELSSQSQVQPCRGHIDKT